MADEGPESDGLIRLCGLLIGAGKALPVAEIAGACQLSDREIADLLPHARQRLLTVGLCLLHDDRARWFVALDVSTKAQVARLNGGPSGRRQISTEAAEILALLREKGPLTVKEIERIRGANPRNALATLCELGLVHRSGRAKGRGGAWLYTVGVDPGQE